MHQCSKVRRTWSFQSWSTDIYSILNISVQLKGIARREVGSGLAAGKARRRRAKAKEESHRPSSVADSSKPSTNPISGSNYNQSFMSGMSILSSPEISSTGVTNRGEKLEDTSNNHRPISPHHAQMSNPSDIQQVIYPNWNSKAWNRILLMLLCQGDQSSRRCTESWGD
jgi:hypothetical protein